MDRSYNQRSGSSDFRDRGARAPQPQKMPSSRQGQASPGRQGQAAPSRPNSERAGTARAGTGRASASSSTSRTSSSPSTSRTSSSTSTSRTSSSTSTNRAGSNSSTNRSTTSRPGSGATTNRTSSRAGSSATSNRQGSGAATSRSTTNRTASRSTTSRTNSSRSNTSTTNRAKSSVNRSKVEYDQSAKTDLAAQAYKGDTRIRYANYRSDKPVRVLGTPEESRLRNRSIINPRYEDSYYDDAYYDDAYYGSDERGYQNNRNYRNNRNSSYSSRGYSERPAPRNARATTVREYRQRKPAKKSRLSSQTIKLLAVAIILTVLLGSGFGVYNSSLFTIKEVTVEGTQYISEKRIKELAVIPEGSTLLRIRLSDMKALIEAEPWVASVDIHRSFPSTIVITITERKVVAVVEVLPQVAGEANQLWLISKDGFWLGFYEQQDIYTAEAEIEEDAKAAAEGNKGGEEEGEDSAEGADAQKNTGNNNSGAGASNANNALTGQALNGDPQAENPEDENPETGSVQRGKVRVFEGIYLPPADLKALPYIKEISKSVEPKLGRLITDEGLLNALAIVNGCSPLMLQIVLTISAPDKIQTKLSLRNHVVVDFGAAEDIKAKEKVILEFLNKYEGRIVYINVRIPDRVTYRLA